MGVEWRGRGWSGGEGGVGVEWGWYLWRAPSPPEPHLDNVPIPSITNQLAGG